MSSVNLIVRALGRVVCPCFASTAVPQRGSINVPLTRFLRKTALAKNISRGQFAKQIFKPMIWSGLLLPLIILTLRDNPQDPFFQIALLLNTAITCIGIGGFRESVAYIFKNEEKLKAIQGNNHHLQQQEEEISLAEEAYVPLPRSFSAPQLQVIEDQVIIDKEAVMRDWLQTFSALDNGADN
jgi:hypothetical protein